ncbi:OLC1v1013973C7 [Oldenlandia corymbosa var. corymbosa]|uniref:OLC1v1013973C7 n=1 Tax=Oldenlandia corymbosa var. corymbosa TaxID=529605 RepID=A0AAV1E2V5_OLDCO|nr:OLC1v1013973C7 [Oldenlandia corymbosa var. corymbosa]
MDFWQKARNLAEEAAKRSQELTNGITVPTKLSDVVSEASKRSIEIATEASRKSKEIAAEALKRADQIKSQLPPAAVAFSSLVDNNSPPAAPEVSEADLEKFGVTDDLREFVKEITLNTFRDFPLEDVSEVSDVPAVSNVRQDLTEWQEKHAKLVLATVKEIKKLRYELCPRVMKERKFWRIYFMLVNSHVDPYEKRYVEEQKLKATEELKENQANEKPLAGTSSGAAGAVTNQKSKTATSEQDLDVFLLGDAGDSDDGPGM